MINKFNNMVNSDTGFQMDTLRVGENSKENQVLKNHCKYKS